MTSNVPLSHTEPTKFRVDGKVVLPDADLPSADMFIVAGDYFGALRIAPKRGRLLTARDGIDEPPAALVRESFAATYFPETDAIGRRVRPGAEGDHGPWLTIVGIVADARSVALDRQADAAIYQSQASYAFHYTRLVARVAGDPMRFEGAVRAAIRSLDPLQPIFHVQPMDDYVSASIADRRFALTLLAALGFVALLLAAPRDCHVACDRTAVRRRHSGPGDGHRRNCDARHRRPGRLLRARQKSRTHGSAGGDHF